MSPNAASPSPPRLAGVWADIVRQAAELIATVETLPPSPTGDALRLAARSLAEGVQTAAAETALAAGAAIALGRGELTARIQSHGDVANALKSIQSTLRHLAWQAQAVADGNLEIQIYGLGPLGEAFNRMAQRLREGRDALAAKNAELADRNRQIEAAYEVIDREFKVVADIQVSLLPSSVPVLPGFEAATHYQPATRAGGDYYDFFPLAGNRLGVLIADVSGHGAPAAVVMAMTRVVLHSSQWPLATEQCSTVLRTLNRILCENILPGQFVTCCYGVLDPPAARTFTFSSAGHPTPVLWNGANGPAESCTSEGGFPLGIVPDAQYPASSVCLPAGAVLALYTDGITEAFSAAHEQFGEDRFRATLAGHAHEGAPAIRDAILQALDAHRGPVPLADDTTLVLLKAQ